MLFYILKTTEQELHIFRSSINTHRVRKPILNGVGVVPTSQVREPVNILAYTDCRKHETGLASSNGTTSTPDFFNNGQLTKRDLHIYCTMIFKEWN
jgi:hypothetical protein